MITKKGQLNFPIVLLTVFVFAVIIFAFMPGLNAIIQVFAFSSSLADPGVKLGATLLPFAFMLCITLYLFLALRFNGGG